MVIKPMTMTILTSDEMNISWITWMNRKLSTRYSWLNLTIKLYVWLCSVINQNIVAKMSFKLVIVSL